MGHVLGTGQSHAGDRTRRGAAGDGPGAVLSDRERDVLALIADGRTGAGIARELFLSSTTIERHVASGLRKLGAKNRAHGIALAIRSGELDGTAPPTPDEPGMDALLLQTLDRLEDPAAVLDARGDVLVVNEAWRAFGRANGRTGVQREAGYVATCEESTECDDATRAARGLRALLDGRSESFRMEYRCDAPGEPRWFELRAARYRGGHGSAAVLVRHCDLTGRRRAERDAHTRASLLGEVSAATVVWSPDGIVTAWTGGTERLVGWTAEEAVGRPVRDLVLPRRDHARAIVEATRSTGRWSGELRLERKDGTTVQADVRTRELRDADGRLTGTMGVAVDAGQQHRARRSAAAAEARLQALAAAMRDGWIAGDAAGRITHVNAAAEELLGWRAGELLGRRIDDVTGVANPFRPLTRPPGAGGPPREVRGVCLVAADGHAVPVRCTTSGSCGGEGLAGWTVVFRVDGEEK
jgi:PAS domain S-box-containing protein